MKRVAKFVLPIAALAVLAGCRTTAKTGESLSDIQWNPTPGLSDPALRFDDSNSRVAYSINDNMRKFTDDWGRFWLVDRGSNLSPYPMVK
ncbi:MAG: hypothetical protein KF805_07775 [Phycisphaeraceae bacterium]|nr:hypothetical protein [Phycisphaeraceae bacterium]